MFFLTNHLSKLSKNEIYLFLFGHLFYVFDPDNK